MHVQRDGNIFIYVRDIVAKASLAYAARSFNFALVHCLHMFGGQPASPEWRLVFSEYNAAAAAAATDATPLAIARGWATLLYSNSSSSSSNINCTAAAVQGACYAAARLGRQHSRRGARDRIRSG